MKPTVEVWDGFKMLDELEHFATEQTITIHHFRIPDDLRGTKYDFQRKRV